MKLKNGCNAVEMIKTRHPKRLVPIFLKRYGTKSLVERETK